MSPVTSYIFPLKQKVMLKYIQCLPINLISYLENRETWCSEKLWFAPSLELFRASMDRPLSNLVSWKVSLPMAVGLELGDLFNSPSNPNNSMNITLEILKFAHTSAAQNIILKSTETILP